MISYEWHNLEQISSHKYLEAAFFVLLTNY